MDGLRLPTRSLFDAARSQCGCSRSTAGDSPSSGTDGSRARRCISRRSRGCRTSSLVNFYGFGNNTSSNATSDAFRVDQRQWQFRPAVAYALGRPRSDISLGPVVQYSTSSTNAGRLIGDQQPYGFGTFGEAGVRPGSTLRFARQRARCDAGLLRGHEHEHVPGDLER